jgi:hypothetical protein
VGRWLGRLAEASEHALDGLRLGDDGDELHFVPTYRLSLRSPPWTPRTPSTPVHLPLALRALEHVDAEGALEQLGPGSVAAAASLGRHRGSVDVFGRGYGGRGGLGHDARAELARGGEHEMSVTVLELDTPSNTVTTNIVVE